MSYSFVENAELVGASVLDFLNPFNQLHFVTTGEVNTPLTAEVAADQLYSHGDLSRTLTDAEKTELARNGGDKVAKAGGQVADTVGAGVSGSFDVAAWIALHWKPIVVITGGLIAGAYLLPVLLSAKAATK